MRYQAKSNFTLKLCPSCKQTWEIVEHFLQCPHPEQQLLWDDLLCKLSKQWSTIKFHPQSVTIWHKAYAAALPWQHSNCYQTPPNHYISNSNSTTGWDGQKYALWLLLPSADRLHPLTGANHQQTQQFITTPILATGQQVLAIWCIWNGHFHPTMTHQDADHSQIRSH